MACPPLSPWCLSHRADPPAVALADRHYSRQKVGSRSFVPPGRCLVLLTPDLDAVWATSWPFREYVRHAWAGAWICSIFRNESPAPASELIRAAVSATRFYFGDPPPEGFVTFINTEKVRPIRRKGRPYWGYTFEKAGFLLDGMTKGGLLAFRMPPESMPPPQPYRERSVFSTQPGRPNRARRVA